MALVGNNYSGLYSLTTTDGLDYINNLPSFSNTIGNQSYGRNRLRQSKFKNVVPFTYIDNQSFKLNVSRIGDLCQFIGIRIKDAYQYNDGIVSIIKLKTLTLRIGGNIIKHIDIQILNNIQDFVQTKGPDTYYNFEKTTVLSDVLKTILLCYHEIELYIELATTIGSDNSHTTMSHVKVECYTQYTTLDNLYRNELINTDNTIAILNTLETTYIDTLQTSEENYEGIRLKTRNCFDGIFLHGIMYRNIEHLSIHIVQLNESTENFIEYNDGFQISMFSTIINDDTFYIPFTNNAMYGSINRDSFSLRPGDSLCLKLITTDVCEENVSVSIMTQKKFIYFNGVGGLHYMIDPLSSVKVSHNTLVSNHKDIVRPIISTLWNINDRTIPSNEDAHCCITLEVIETNDNYIHCYSCHKNFKYIVLQWIDNNNNCPHCRQYWMLHNRISYKNIVVDNIGNYNYDLKTLL